MKSLFIEWMLAPVLIIFCITSFTHASDKTLILSPDDQTALSLAENLSSRIPNSHISSTYISSDYGLVITIGKSTYLTYKDRIKSIPILSTYLYQKSFDDRHINENSHFLFLEPSPVELAKVVQNTLGDKPVGYIYTSKNDPYLKALESKLNIRPYEYNTNLGKTFRKIFRDSSISIFYISDNPNIFNEVSVRQTLKHLYPKRIPAITTSEYFSKSGPVVSVYSPLSEVDTKIVELASAILKGSSIETINYSSHKTVFNKVSARNLNIKLSNAEGLNRDE